MPRSRSNSTNTGTAALILSPPGVSGDFSQTGNCPASLAANAFCTINVSFIPTQVGSRTGTLSLMDNAAGSPHAIPLSGIGQAAVGVGGNSGTPGLILTAAANASSSATVIAGQTAIYQLSVTPVNGFTGTVSLSCTGAPSLCTPSPNPVGISGTASAACNVSVSTLPRSVASSLLGPGRLPPSIAAGASRMLFVALTLLCTAGVFLLCSRPLPARGAGRIVQFAVASCLLICVGCGGSVGSPQQQSPPTVTAGTPAGNYTVVVTATSGAISQSINLSLTVQ